MRTRSLVATSPVLRPAVRRIRGRQCPGRPGSQVLAQSLTATSTATSFHFLATADGTINLGDSFGGAPLPITGTKAEGDVSVTPQGVQLTLRGAAWPRVAERRPHLPQRRHRVREAGAAGGFGSRRVAQDPRPTTCSGQAIGSPAPGAPDMAAQIQEAMTQSGAVLTNEGDVPCAAGTCTKLHLEVPGLGPRQHPRLDAARRARRRPAPPLPRPSRSTSWWTTPPSSSTPCRPTWSRPASGTDVTITIQLSAFNPPVTITAPPADQVTDAPLF